MYAHVILGGTFDHLHKGHIAILARAFNEGEHVTIGLTSEAYIRRFKKGQGVSPFSTRYQMLTRHLRAMGYAPHATIVPLDNRWGPALMGDFDAILVTSHNQSVANEINELRKERGLPILFIITVPLVSAVDAHALSSSRVRKGEIDTTGKLIMPDNLRGILKNPLGKLLTGKQIEEHVRKNRDNITVTVGDITTETLFSHGVKPSCILVDLQVERRPYKTLEALKLPKHYEVVRVVSGPGYISKTAVDAIVEWSKNIRNRKRVAIVVTGEEDLLALPAIIHAPIGTIVYYGNPPSTDRPGLVAVEVTSAKKKEVSKLIEQFY